MTENNRMFQADQLEDAIKELVRLRLVEGWGGDLRVEYDEDDGLLYLTQYNSSNEWTQGSWAIYTIASHEDWNDFLFDCGVHGSADELHIDADQWDADEYEALKKAQKDDDAYVLTGELVALFFAELDWDPILEGSYQQAHQKLLEVKDQIDRRVE